MARRCHVLIALENSFFKRKLEQIICHSECLENHITRRFLLNNTILLLFLLKLFNIYSLEMARNLSVRFSFFSSTITALATPNMK